jgi:transcriptional regulator with XRE-family HTH domain
MPSTVRPISTSGDVQATRRLVHSEGHAIYLMTRVVGFAEAIRLVPQAQEAGFSIGTFNEALAGFARLGVGRHIRPLADPTDASTLAATSEALLVAVEESPMPDAEWAPMSDALGEDLARLLNISPSSLARYRSGERATPDVVAARLHFIAMVVSDLAGSYNNFGIRRWFKRHRSALQDKSPEQILSGDWTVDREEVVHVRDLARSLLGAASS